jgi:hypothetical protein
MLSFVVKTAHGYSNIRLEMKPKGLFVLGCRPKFEAQIYSSNHIVHSIVYIVRYNGGMKSREQKRQV